MQLCLLHKNIQGTTSLKYWITKLIKKLTTQDELAASMEN